MKILCITGSPRKDGNSSILTDEFIKGAKEKGHDIVRIDAAFKNIHPCIACDKCKTEGTCVFKDDFEQIKKELLEADMIVFATPIYYYSMSAQIKTLIDRFYSIDEQLHAPKKSALIMTFADGTLESANPVIANYKGMIGFLGWEDMGCIIAKGVWDKGAVNRTEYPKQAYELGKSL